MRDLASFGIWSLNVKPKSVLLILRGGIEGVRTAKGINEVGVEDDEAGVGSKLKFYKILPELSFRSS